MNCEKFVDPARIMLFSRSDINDANQQAANRATSRVGLMAPMPSVSCVRMKCTLTGRQSWAQKHVRIGSFCDCLTGIAGSHGGYPDSSETHITRITQIGFQSEREAVPQLSHG